MSLIVWNEKFKYLNLIQVYAFWLYVNIYCINIKIKTGCSSYLEFLVLFTVYVCSIFQI